VIKKPSAKDLKDWQEFIKNPGPIHSKEQEPQFKKFNKRKLDLHGSSLDTAIKKTKDFLEQCIETGINEAIIITGKGLHSPKSDVYNSDKYNKLKYLIPEAIKSFEEIADKISVLEEAEQKDGGAGAIKVKFKKLKE